MHPNWPHDPDLSPQSRHLPRAATCGPRWPAHRYWSMWTARTTLAVHPPPSSRPAGCGPRPFPAPPALIRGRRCRAALCGRCRTGATGQSPRGRGMTRRHFQKTHGCSAPGCQKPGTAHAQNSDLAPSYCSPARSPLAICLCFAPKCFPSADRQGLKPRKCRLHMPICINCLSLRQCYSSLTDRTAQRPGGGCIRCHD